MLLVGVLKGPALFELPQDLRVLVVALGDGDVDGELEALAALQRADEPAVELREEDDQRGDEDGEAQLGQPETAAEVQGAREEVEEGHEDGQQSAVEGQVGRCEHSGRGDEGLEGDRHHGHQEDEGLQLGVEVLLVAVLGAEVDADVRIVVEGAGDDAAFEMGLLGDEEAREEEGEEGVGEEEEEEEEEVALDGPAEEVPRPPAGGAVRGEVVGGVQEVVAGEQELEVGAVEVELLLAEEVAKGDEVEREVVEAGEEQQEHPEGEVLLQREHQLVTGDDLVQPAHRVLAAVDDAQRGGVELLEPQLDVLDVLLGEVVDALHLGDGVEEALDVGELELARAAGAGGEQAAAAEEPAARALDVLQAAEVLVLVHPAALEEVVLVLVALQLVHLLGAALEDGDERIDADALEALELADDLALVAHLHAHGPEQVAHELVAEGALLQPQQVHHQVLALQTLHALQQPLALLPADRREPPAAPQELHAREPLQRELLEVVRPALILGELVEPLDDVLRAELAVLAQVVRQPHRVLALHQRPLRRLRNLEGLGAHLVRALGLALLQVAALAQQLGHGGALLGARQRGGGGAVVVERAEDLLLRVVDVHDRVLVGLVGQTQWEGGVELDRRHDLVEDEVVERVLHRRQQPHLHGLVHVAKHHLPRDDLVVLADVLVGDQHLLHRQQPVQLLAAPRRAHRPQVLPAQQVRQRARVQQERPHRHRVHPLDHLPQQRLVVPRRQPQHLEDHAHHVEEHQQQQAEVGHVLQVLGNAGDPLLEDGLVGERVAVGREEALEEGLLVGGEGEHLEGAAGDRAAAAQQHRRGQAATLEVDLELQVALVLHLAQAALERELPLHAAPHELLVQRHLALRHQHPRDRHRLVEVDEQHVAHLDQALRDLQPLAVPHHPHLRRLLAEALPAARRERPPSQGHLHAQGQRHRHHDQHRPRLQVRRVPHLPADELQQNRHQQQGHLAPQQLLPQDAGELLPMVVLGDSAQVGAVEVLVFDEGGRREAEVEVGVDAAGELAGGLEVLLHEEDVFGPAPPEVRLHKQLQPLLLYVQILLHILLYTNRKPAQNSRSFPPASSRSAACSYSPSSRSSRRLAFTPHTEGPRNRLRRLLLSTSLSTVRLPVKSSYPLPTLLTTRQQSACLTSAFLAAAGRTGGTVTSVKRWLLRVRHLTALRKPANSRSWQQEAGREARSSFFVLVSFSSACALRQLSSTWRQSSRTDPEGYWCSRSRSSRGPTTSLPRSVKAMRSSRESWLSLMSIWSQRQAISDFPSAFWCSSRLSGGLMRCFQRGELSQTMLVSPCAQWWLRKQRQSERQFVDGWSSSITIRCPFASEFPKIASRSGCPKQQRWLVPAFSTFLKDDFIINLQYFFYEWVDNMKDFFIVKKFIYLFET